MTWYNISILIFVALFVTVGWLWRYKIKPHFAKNELHEKLKHHPHWAALIKTEGFLLDLYRGLDTSSISRQERKRLGIDDDAFIYGEIEFLPFYTILEKVKPQPQEIFYDLGSGAGKAVFVAASYFNISKAYGIELLPALHDVANAQLTKAKNLCQAQKQTLADIEFVQANFLERDITQGDIIFINATCLSYYAWEALLTKLMVLKKGSRVIVTSKRIQHPAFEVMSQTFELMSWGMNSVNIYRKIDLAPLCNNNFA